MIYFPPLRTRRLTVQLRELTIGDSLALAAMPGHLGEASCTAFLRHAVESAKGLADPTEWTVQERMLAVCHYLAATAEDGPDFSLGKGHYSDYLDGAADIHTATEQHATGEIGGDIWYVRHLTGLMSESIERLVGEIPGMKPRLHWLVGAMAAQMVRAEEEVPDGSSGEGAFDEFLLARMKIMLAFPESDFEALMALHLAGQDELHHLFRIEFTDDGIVAMPKGGVTSKLPPARFPVYTCLSRLARELVGKPDDVGV